jgi:hypothetical protein
MEGVADVARRCGSRDTVDQDQFVTRFEEAA